LQGHARGARVTVAGISNLSREPAMPDRSTCQSLIDAVERYFELMFDNDVSRFDQVFASSAQLHGLRDGKLRLLAAHEYKNALATGPSPKSKNAPRQQEILLVDFASPTQAMVKVRVRIDTILYLDYLSYHCINGVWLITAKSFHQVFSSSLFILSGDTKRQPPDASTKHRSQCPEALSAQLQASCGYW
jgi:hypothetical protein